MSPFVVMLLLRYCAPVGGVCLSEWRTAEQYASQAECEANAPALLRLSVIPRQIDDRSLVGWSCRLTVQRKPGSNPRVDFVPPPDTR